MANYWVISSYTLDNIERAYERLMWGFTDPTIKKDEKYAKNWKDFIKFYNRVSSSDILIFQVFHENRYHIYGIGIAQEKFYDDETPIWEEEIRLKRVIYPWKIRFSIMLFSETPITQLAIPAHEYVKGYGIGKLSRGDVETIVESIEETTGLRVKFL